MCPNKEITGIDINSEPSLIELRVKTVKEECIYE